MKELSIKEKAQRYDEAIGRVVNIKTGKCETTFIFTEGLLNYLFPELEECNEEEVRKAMIDFFKHEREEGVTVLHYGVNIERMIAWLEKQGQVNETIISQHEDKTCKENNDSLTSEDERIRKALICHISKISTEIPVGALHRINGVDIPDILAWLEKQKTSEEAMQYLKENHSPSEVSDFQAAMNIAVAKAYDKGVKDGLENRGQTFTKKDVDDAWLKGMCDAKHELKKISQRMISAEAKEAMYGKPTAWSEEDKVMLDKVIKRLRKHSVVDEEYLDIYYWLKSLKQRIGG